MTVFSDGLILSLISDGLATDMPRKNSVADPSLISDGINPSLISDGSVTELRLKINKKEIINSVADPSLISDGIKIKNK